MLSRRRWTMLGVVAAAAGLLGCAERMTAVAPARDLAIRVPRVPPRLAPDLITGTPLGSDSSGSGSSGPSTAPTGVPDWLGTYITTIDVTAEVGFDPSGGTAWGQTNINYNGTNASGSHTLTLQKTGTTGVTASSTQTGQDYGFTALPKHLVVPTTLPLAGVTCGLTAGGSGSGSVWNSYFINFSWTTWGLITKPAAAAPVAQANCATNGGGSGVVICYTIIYYDLNTGEYLGETPLGCFQS